MNGIAPLAKSAVVTRPTSRWIGRTQNTKYQLDPADHLTPDKLFDRASAVTLLDRVLNRLLEENGRDGKAAEFEILKPFLTAGARAIPYQNVAAALGANEGAARVAVHRLRRRYRDLLRDEIAQTLSDPGQLEEELGHYWRHSARGASALSRKE